MPLYREPEQQQRETNVRSDHMTSEYKALRRNPPDVRLTSGKKFGDPVEGVEVTRCWLLPS